MGFKGEIKEWWSGGAYDISGFPPPSSRLDFATRELIRFYSTDSINVISDYSAYQGEGTGEIELGEAEIAEMQVGAEAYQKLRSLFQDTSSGALGIEDLTEEIDLNCVKLGDELNRLVAVKFENWLPSGVCETTTQDKFGVMDQCGYLVDNPLKQGSGSMGLEEKRSRPMGGNEPGPSDAVNNPYLSAIMLNSPRLCPANAMSRAGSIFMNAIPTHEMSQCVPYISIDIVSEGNFLTNGGRLMSLFGFTGESPSSKDRGYFGDSNSGIDFQTLTAERDLGQWWDSVVNKAVKGEALDPTTTEATEFEVNTRRIAASGIELFQAPQTMNKIGGGGGLNPTVPLATLTSLTVEVSGLGLSTLCNKTAALEFVLHDRSQLRMIAPLVGASTFASTYLNIEFGWSHPQATSTNSGNVYANFLNSLRSRSSFNIQMADTSMMEDGQVKVRLKLASRGVTELVNLPAASGVSHVPAYVLQPFLGPLTEQIADNAAGYSGVLQSAEEGLKEGNMSPVAKLSEARLTEIQNGYSALSSMTSPAAQIPLDKYRELLNVLRPELTDAGATADRSAAIALGVEIIKDIYEISAEGDTSISETLGMQLSQKALLLRSIDIFEDGFTVVGAEDEARNLARAAQQATMTALMALVSGASAANIAEHFENINKARALEDKNRGSLNPSLGSAMMAYVGRPLQAIGKYDEVQMIFYPFNSQAGRMADVNIARFPLIGFDSFIVGLDIENPRVSCSSFAEQLFSDTCGPENPGHPNYGLADLYRRISPEALEGMEEESKEAARQQFLKDKAERLTKLYKSPGRQPIFTIPDLNIFIECLPMRERDGGIVNRREKQCVRIHVYDAKAGIPVEAELLQSMVTSGRVALKIEADGSDGPDIDADEEHTVERQTAQAAKDAQASRGEKIQERLLEQGLIETRTVDEDTATNRPAQLIFVNSGPAEVIKEAIKSIYPHIDFGSQYTNVKSIGMSSNTGGAVGQVLLLNAIESSRTSLGGEAQPSAGLDDIFIVPTRATLRIAGYPNVRYAEKYYIDMGTGTTADNFYYVTGIQHTLGPGNFETTLTMTYNGSATNRSLRNTMESIANAKND